MESESRRGRRLVLVAMVVGLVFAVFAPSAFSAVSVRFGRIAGFRSPGTPAKYDKVGILEIGPARARRTSSC